MRQLSKKEFRERALRGIKKRQVQKKKEQEFIIRKYFIDTIYKSKQKANRR